MKVMLQKKMLMEKKMQKKRRTILKVKNDLRFIKKKMFHICLVKRKNHNHNKIKPKIFQKSVTNSYQQSHDDWRFMALDKCCCWLEEERWRKEKFKEQGNRSGKEDKRFEWSRMKCFRSNTTGRSERVGWDSQEPITLWTSNSHTRPMSRRFYGPPCLWAQSEYKISKRKTRRW